ncbi:hypothetical protein D3C78_1918280 [compost metagenome]
MINPSWLIVEKASIAFRSVCLIALNEPKISVISPTPDTSQNQAACPENTGVNLATRYNPALTIVAECK